jgi:drug/metabolite transporter (DMT)-like permease
VDVVLALAAAFLFALGSVLQQKAGLAAPSEGSSSGLLLRMARRPVWLVGIAADSIGFCAQAAALAIGRLAVVQPVLVASLVFTLPLGRRFTGQRITRLDVVAAVLVTGALAAFLTIADPGGGRDDAPLEEWMLTGAIALAVIVPLLLLARGAHPPRRAALLGTATGVLFALSAALTKVVADRFADGVLEVFTSWHLYALVVVGYASMTFNQMALTTGALAAAVATSMAFDPIVSVVLGVTLLEESIHDTTLGSIAALAALIAALVGIAILARSQNETPGAKPLSGSAVGDRA